MAKKKVTKRKSNPKLSKEAVNCRRRLHAALKSIKTDDDLGEFLDNIYVTRCMVVTGVL